MQNRWQTLKPIIMNKLNLILILFTTLSYAQNETIKFANADAPSQNIGKDSLAVSGYDLTEYLTNKNATKGSSKYQHGYQGVKYFFMKEKNKSNFIENPEKYLPQ